MRGKADAHKKIDGHRQRQGGLHEAARPGTGHTEAGGQRRAAEQDGTGPIPLGKSGGRWAQQVGPAWCGTSATSLRHSPPPHTHTHIYTSTNHGLRYMAHTPPLPPPMHPAFCLCFRFQWANILGAVRAQSCVSFMHFACTWAQAEEGRYNRPIGWHSVRSLSRRMQLSCLAFSPVRRTCCTPARRPARHARIRMQWLAHGHQFRRAKNI